MKKRVALFLAMLFAVCFLCSCEKANDIIAYTFYKEYDSEAFDFADIQKILNEIYDSKEYFISNVSEGNYYIVPVAEERKNDGTLIINVFETNEMAKKEFEMLIFHTSPQEYRSCVVRINNLLFNGYTSALKNFLIQYHIETPESRLISNKMNKSFVDKKIDVEKLINMSNEKKYWVYSYNTGLFNEAGEELINYSIIDERGSSMLRILDGFDIGNEQWFDLFIEINDTTGTFIQYENCAFIFLDDFWLDMIKQCEK